MGPDELVKQFAQYGGLIGLLMGVLVVGMGTAILFLWRHNAALQERLHATQDKRVDEAKEVRSELMAFSEESNKAVSEMGAAINALKDAVMMRQR